MNFTENNVKNICAWLELNRPDKECDFYKTWICVEILRVIIGNEWTNQAIFPNCHPVKSREVKKSISFLQTDKLGFRFQERVCRLANRLYDIQNIPNLQKVINAILQGDIFLGYAEIEASSFFYRRGLKHEFVLPSGRKGQDFDIKLIGDFIVNCEVKHKIEDTIPSKETFERTLSSAKSQVPENSPALFFIKIPEEWLKYSNLNDLITRTKGTFFPRSKNILGFILYWEEQSLENPGIFLWKYRYEINLECEFEAVDFHKKIRSSPDDLTDTLIKLMNKYLVRCKTCKLPQCSLRRIWPYSSSLQ